MCSHSDKDWLPLKGHYVCFLYTWLEGSVALVGPPQLSLAAIASSITVFRSFSLWFSSLGVTLQQGTSCPVPALAWHSLDSLRWMKVLGKREISVFCLASSSALHLSPQILSINLVLLVFIKSSFEDCKVSEHWELMFSIMFAVQLECCFPSYKGIPFEGRRKRTICFIVSRSSFDGSSSAPVYALVQLQLKYKEHMLSLLWVCS